MELQQILHYLATYGVIFMFLIVFLEYLNLPGVPSGVVMPAAGILISQTEVSFLYFVIMSVIAGVLGSIVLYFVGYIIGEPFLQFCYKRFPKSKVAVEKALKWNEKHDGKEILVARLIPFLRTFISAISGVFRVNITQFLTYSVTGIVIWNTSLICLGYFFGDLVINKMLL